MIIDCHGHYTTAPPAHKRFREAQLARLADPSLPEPEPAEIHDDEIRESIEGNQLKLLRERGGDVNVTIECAGQFVSPGDVVVADDDGVVVVPRASAAEVLEGAREREANETVSRARYAAGELSLDVQEMRGELERKGLRYVDE